MEDRYQSGSTVITSHLLLKGSLTERSSFIRSFVKEIRIVEGKARLTYASPVLQGGVDDDAVPILGIEQRGGPNHTFEIIVRLFKIGAVRPEIVVMSNDKIINFFIFVGILMKVERTIFLCLYFSCRQIHQYV